MKRNRKIFASIFILFGLSVVLYIYYIFNPFTFLKKNCDIESKFYYSQDSRKVEPLKTIIDFNDRNTYYIVLHINPFEVYLLPDSIKKFPILYLKDKKDVELFIKEFKFEWDGYSFYETTDSFKNNLFIIKNGEVFCSLICSLTYEGFSVFSDKTGWIFPTNQKKIMNIMQRMKPLYHPFYVLSKVERSA